MSRRSERERERLTALLIEGDPAGDTPPAREQVRQLRARLLVAAGDLAPARRPRVIPAAAWRWLPATGLVFAGLAVYFASTVWMRPATPPRPNGPQPRVGQTAARIEAPADTAVAGSAPRPWPRRERKATASAALPSRVAPRQPSPRTEMAADEERPRQVHFVAPGGTRIVWSIDTRPAASTFIQQEDLRCGAN